MMVSKHSSDYILARKLDLTMHWYAYSFALEWENQRMRICQSMTTIEEQNCDLTTVIEVSHEPNMENELLKFEGKSKDGCCD